MRSRSFQLLVVVLVCAFSAVAQSVNEIESSIILNEKDANVSLVVENQGAAAETKVELEVLDNEDKARARTVQNIRLKEGKGTYTIVLPLGDLMRTSETQIAWFRLRYLVGDTQGIVSLSQVIKDIFELRVIATDQVLAGMNYRARVIAANPFTGVVVSGVQLAANAVIDPVGDGEKKLELSSMGETDADGFATLEFQIPVESVLGGDGEIKISGKKNGIYREVIEDLSPLEQDSQFLMMTDKPIYQPDQTFNVRGILMKGAESKVVTAGAEIEFSVEDEEDTVLYREKTSTSAFGIASISWKIPEGAKLGTYRVRVRGISDENEYLGYKNFKISRYDLPNFAVSAKPNKQYYVPADTQAEIEVNADYLFGKPVIKGKVRIARENEREWNWKEQKYDIDEGDSKDGDTDANGKFTARFDLDKDLDDLKDNNWRKFQDLHFTAYFTDLSTNRTEQRRFDIRITKEPIHVYLIGESYGNNPKLQYEGYISTYYADGTPASCDVDVQISEDEENKFRPLQKVKTNRYGLARIRFVRPDYGSDESDIDIKATAKDKSGQKGTLLDDVGFSANDDIRVLTEKTIYKPGEAIDVKVTSTLREGTVYVDVVKGWSVIDSHFVKLKNGAATVNIPYQPLFERDLKIAAYIEKKDETELIETSRGIIYPSPQNLNLSTTFSKETYKPGEEATVSFGVTDTVGQAVESALGSVIFDKAVEERARTEDAFNTAFSSYSSWLGYGENIGGFNRKDINEFDLSKPVSADMQLVAEAMLYNEYYHPNLFESRKTDTDAGSVYAGYFKAQFAPVEDALNAAYKANFDHSRDDPSLRRILSPASIDFYALKDPWEKAYRADFSVKTTNDVVRFISSGADEKFGTRDDLTVSSLSFTYFTPTGRAIEKAVEDHHRRTGLFIRDEKTLFAELGVSGLTDNYGRPYRIIFETSGRYYVIRIRSLGPDGVYSPYYSSDDFDVWTNRIDYFTEIETKIRSIMERGGPFPRDEAEFRSTLRKGGVDLDTTRDGSGEKVFVTLQKYSQYFDKVTVQNSGTFGDKNVTEKTVVVPVTREILVFEIKGRGPDKKEYTYDDFTLVRIQRVLSEQTKDDIKPKPSFAKIAYAGNGSIGGTITDVTGAVISSVTVTATREETGQTGTATSNEEGRFTITNLAAGTYTVKASVSGFKDTVWSGVVVTADSTTMVNFSMEAGSVSETVTVTADGVQTVSTESAQVSNTVSSSAIADLPLNGRRLSRQFIAAADADPETAGQKSTPRLREYFPETLLWSPELITGPDGKAQIKFKLADNITTWKLYTIASTRNGKVGVVEKEFTAFQSFFVDLESPKFLTSGDEIALPVQVRNYTAKKQKVDVSMAKGDWFSFLAGEKQQIDVDKNNSKNAIFRFKAIEAVKEGKQRVTAIAEDDSDAIEKPVTVRPDGDEVVKTSSQFFTGSAQFETNFPANALAKTQKAELKIYPNLFSHVAESVEGLLQRPYGCGEQTISSTYPNLMILKFVTSDSALKLKAQKYLQKGYERLIGYQTADGGFSYWGGKDAADIALTAYALRFLSEAKPFVTVDETVVKRAQDWLIKQQNAEGAFINRRYSTQVADPRQTKLFTAYVARTLGMTKNKDEAAMAKALGYLKAKNAEIDEPYSLALYGLAALDAGDAASARLVAVRLQAMSKQEGDAIYWNLESNTPFYGWGTAGRLETTALVLQLLIRDAQMREEKDTERDIKIGMGMLFMLKNKDRYGVWYSTQTTINVLDTLLAALAPMRAGVSDNITISVNGKDMPTVTVPADQITPVTMDLTGELDRAQNRIGIRSTGNSPLMAQVVGAHYVGWPDSESTKRNVNDSRALRMDYKCDRDKAAIMQEITCRVEAERTGFQGYGMLLAEIGTPPGADVSRESLQQAMETDWSISRYDILPDRIVVYMWAKAGGTKFSFKFKPRYGINAQTPASVVYDYYNPEARALVAPLRFMVGN